MLANHQRLLIGAIALCGCLFDCLEGDAQVRRYQPSKPTVSNYLNLTRQNNGAVPNYYSLVRPMQRQREFNLQEQSLRRQQAGAIQQLQNDVQQGLQPASPTGRQSGFMRPSARSTFGTSNRYFQTKSVRLGRR